MGCQGISQNKLILKDNAHTEKHIKYITSVQLEEFSQNECTCERSIKIKKQITVSAQNSPSQCPLQWPSLIMVTIVGTSDTIKQCSLFLNFIRMEHRTLHLVSVP